MVGIVPDMFQVPINAPILSKIKIGLTMEASAALPDWTISSHECPFLRMMRLVTMALKISATCIGPSVASDLNKKTAPAIRTMSVTTGMMASAYDGSLALRDPLD